MNVSVRPMLGRLLGMCAAAVFALSPAAVVAADGSIDEGIEYQRVVPPQPTRVPDGKVEVLELFWYGCPHCHAFEPHLRKWLESKPGDVAFRRMPAQLNPNWKIHAAAYYVAEELGVVEKIHKPLFDAMHNDNKRLDTLDSLAEFFGQHGVSREDFMAAYHSFAVRAKMRHSEQQVRRYGATSVPTIVVAGKYRTNASMAGGSFDALLNVVNQLVEKERSERDTAN